MATSGTYTWEPVIDELLIEAWERCGKTSASLTGEVARSARRSIQSMLISWANLGLNLWMIDQQTQVLTPGINEFTTPVGTTDILEMTITVGGVEAIMSPISRDEFAYISLKGVSSAPTQFWSERVNPVPIIHLYPTPNLPYVVTYNRIRLPQDTTGLSTDIDAPVLWKDAIEAELASRLSTKFALDRKALLKNEAKEAYDAASGYNRERVNITISPRAWP